MLNTSLEGTESNSGDVGANDFRKITLIRDPLSSSSSCTQQH